VFADLTGLLYQIEIRLVSAGPELFSIQRLDELPAASTSHNAFSLSWHDKQLFCHKWWTPLDASPARK